MSISQGVQFVTVTEHEAEQRIDNFLRTKLKGVPKTLIYRIIRKGEVRVNKGRIKPEYKLKIDDVVRIPPVRVADRATPPPASTQLKSVLDHAIIEDNALFMAINKPAGLAVHGGSGVTLGMIEALRQSYPQYPYLELVHRLDRDTSGVILVAKKRSSLKYLQSLFRGDKKIKKTYVALVEGRWPNRRKLIDQPLLRFERQSGERMVKVSLEGKSSKTAFEVMTRFGDDATLVTAQPITGRTHQIRVHAQYVGCPLACDPKYGNEEFTQQCAKVGLKRLFLHAKHLEFSDSEGKRIRLSAPLPTELEKAVAQLSKKYVPQA